MTKKKIEAMNIRTMKSTGYAVLLLLLTLEFACAQSTTDQQSFTLELKDVQVYQVQAKEPYTYKDKENKTKEVNTAYLVKLVFDKRPQPTNDRIDFYIGDYRIPEYGGTSEGIYFRLIEPGLLDKLNNQAIGYQIGSQQKVSLKKNFMKPDTRTLKPQTEESILKQK
jgi:hypothetical protein